MSNNIRETVIRFKESEDFALIELTVKTESIRRTKAQVWGA